MRTCVFCGAEELYSRNWMSAGEGGGEVGRGQESGELNGKNLYCLFEHYED
ncbi:hypothetical protein sscle_01g009510 [Sclerotinia sclerotiorum 1980 UF-70]|uniref:Uncharacterized protein n=1 Tax=Sclerotinia sclerotiorum (strain ATCC 18683 / 1980 / Ss-1) TaxID=665079 RepID=A0A1D9PTX5_SCLS1|nr:hypothetical protein sscle_01g009510 [Sclerotinia sclerotiorum 1980 UF-70]